MRCFVCYIGIPRYFRGAELKFEVIDSSVCCGLTVGVSIRVGLGACHTLRDWSARARAVDTRARDQHET